MRARLAPLCVDQAPHFTTIAHFVSTLGDDIARVFAAVVAICYAHTLIGREMFAIDGVKLPSHASKRRSGTPAGVEQQAAKYETLMLQLLLRHRAADTDPPEPPVSTKEHRRLERLAPRNPDGTRETRDEALKMAAHRCKKRNAMPPRTINVATVESR